MQKWQSCVCTLSCRQYQQLLRGVQYSTLWDPLFSSKSSFGSWQRQKSIYYLKYNSTSNRLVANYTLIRADISMHSLHEQVGKCLVGSPPPTLLPGALSPRARTHSGGCMAKKDTGRTFPALLHALMGCAGRAVYSFPPRYGTAGVPPHENDKME